MVLFRRLSSAESDWPRSAQDRLAAIHGVPLQASDQVQADLTKPLAPDPADVDPADVDRADANPAGGPPGDAAPRPREGRLVRWWVPAPLRDARWEPGRPGALMLSLVAALAAVIAAVGVWWERPVPVPAPMLPLVAPASAADSAISSTAAPELVISVVGRVARPGLVRLPDGSRVADAVDAVGGALPDTDLMGLNLARRLSDGEQLMVGVTPPPGQPADGGVGGAPAGTDPVVNLNTATVDQLDALPGVGPVTAQRILDWRVKHGRFTSVDQLREVSGIGQARFAQLRDLVRV
ncbi:MAG: helix-hairpin-helix domain-containing protein [Pseudonocardiaceae bacterium]